ncbi:MAG: hypothetical protein WAL29_09805 [Bacteroidales bacterium]
MNNLKKTSTSLSTCIFVTCAVTGQSLTGDYHTAKGNRTGKTKPGKE